MGFFSLLSIGAVVGVVFAVARLADKQGKRPVKSIKNHNFSINDNRHIDKPNRFMDELEVKYQKSLAKSKEWERQQGYFWTIQRNGKAAETNNDIDSAIRYYEEALEFAYKNEHLRSNNYCSTMERLVILYSKIKDYSKEVDMIKTIIKDSPNASIKKKYKERLPKALKRLDKVN